MSMTTMSILQSMPRIFHLKKVVGKYSYIIQEIFYDNVIFAFKTFALRSQKILRLWTVKYFPFFVNLLAKL